MKRRGDHERKKSKGGNEVDLFHTSTNFMSRNGLLGMIETRSRSDLHEMTATRATVQLAANRGKRTAAVTTPMHPLLLREGKTIDMKGIAIIPSLAISFHIYVSLCKWTISSLMEPDTSQSHEIEDYKTEPHATESKFGGEYL